MPLRLDPGLFGVLQLGGSRAESAYGCPITLKLLINFKIGLLGSREL